METSKTSTGEQSNDLTLFAVDTLVSHSPQQAKEKEQTTLDTFGLGSEMPLAHYDQSTQSWRMSEDISLWGDYKLLESLPKSGMTRSGVLYQQPVWVRPIEENGSLSWPTPRNCTAMAATITPESAWDEKRFPNLETVVGRREWPTPRSSAAMAEDLDVVRERLENGKEYKARLEEAVAMWPTPTSNMSFNPTAQWVNGRRQEGPRGIGMTLKDAVGSGKLNPMWVEWLMGFPLGWTDLED
jgi:hypothetical protein